MLRVPKKKTKMGPRRRRQSPPCHLRKRQRRDFCAHGDDKEHPVVCADAKATTRQMEMTDNSMSSARNGLVAPETIHFTLSSSI